jgi:hypothetical protein
MSLGRDVSSVHTGKEPIHRAAVGPERVRLSDFSKQELFIGESR